MLLKGYLQVLSRPLALSQDETLIDWSLPYQDAAVILINWIFKFKTGTQFLYFKIRVLEQLCRFLNPFINAEEM